jgi:hypothetical protein
MADEAAEVLVLKDQSGGYYVLSRDLIDSARVSQEDVAEIETLLQSDVTGHSAQLLSLSTPFVVAGAFRVQPGFGQFGGARALITEPIRH